METKQKLRPVVAAAFLLLAATISGSIVLAATLPPPTHTHYLFTTINIKGGFFPAAVGINNCGLVSGYYADSAGYGHGFLWQRAPLWPRLMRPARPIHTLGELMTQG